MRISDGGELWINPEIDQGFGFNNTLGVAGFPSGEAYKVGANSPYLRLPRLFYRQIINLGGEEQTIAPAANQMGGNHTTDNVILTIGKFSVTDVFDAKGVFTGMEASCNYASYNWRWIISMQACKKARGPI